VTRARLVRLAVDGTVMTLAILAAPLGVRWAYGSVDGAYVWSCLLMQGTFGASTILFMLLLFRALQRRGASTHRAIAGALTLTVPFMVVSYLVQLALARALPGIIVTDPSEPQSLEFALVTGVIDSLPAIVVFAGMVFLPAMLHDEEDRRRELGAVRREAELLRLRSHLEPHFIINTLNAISGFITESPGEARALVDALGELLGDASRFESDHAVADELRWIERYLEIHQIRFGDVFTVRWDVAPEARGARCPALILQPLVENALKHGVLRRRGGQLVVRAALDDAALVLGVEDDGPALGAPRVGGQGLALVERRVALEGGDGARFTLTRVEDRTVAEVRLPRRAPRAVPGPTPIAAAPATRAAPDEVHP
jgi:hypothetical protein